MYGKPHPESVSSYAEREEKPQSRLVLEDMSDRRQKRRGSSVEEEDQGFSGSTVSVYPKIQ